MIGKSAKMMMCLLWISILVQTSSANPAIATDPTAVADAVVKGGNAIQNAIEKFVNITIGPALKKLEEKIENIKKNIKEIPSRKKILVRQSLGNIYNAKSEMTAIQRVLGSLAEETIAQVDTMGRIIDAIKPEMSESVIARMIELPAKNMAELLLRSKDILGDAQSRYDAIITEMNVVQANLKVFVDDVQDVLRKGSVELEDWTSAKREELNLACIASLLNIVTAGLCFGSVNVGLNAKLAELREEGKELERIAETSKEAINDLFNRITRMRSDIEEEQEIMTKWQSSLSSMKVTFKDVEDLKFMVIYVKKEPLRMLSRLKRACREYLEHVEKNNNE